MKKLFIFIFCFYLFISPVFAETWELAICPTDREDLPTGHKRAKEGDIIAVKPYPWAWGPVERKNYLILIINNLTEEEAMILADPYYEGDLQPDQISNINPPIVAKRKYKVDLIKLKADILPELDLTKVKDTAKTDIYQPFEDANIQINADTLADYDLIQNKYSQEWKKAKLKAD